MRYKILLIISLILVLAGCGTTSVPVIDKSPNRKIPPERVVRPGESLYSIAWEFGLDYKKIAAWNGIKKPYLIQAGQRLRLRPNNNVVATPQPTTKAESSPTTQTTVTKSKPQNQINFAPTPSRWNWPAEGNLVGRFSRSKGINGIQIAGKEGSPVRATASGQVVYAGEGLRGYGKLIIVKHNQDYLSAYAHNQSIIVKEGQQVKAQQRIAQMGSSGADRTMLHFEIRKGGKPVDPLKYLK